MVFPLLHHHHSTEAQKKQTGFSFLVVVQAESRGGQLLAQKHSPLDITKSYAKGLEMVGFPGSNIAPSGAIAFKQMNTHTQTYPVWSLKYDCPLIGPLASSEGCNPHDLEQSWHLRGQIFFFPRL